MEAFTLYYLLLFASFNSSQISVLSMMPEYRDPITSFMLPHGYVWASSSPTDPSISIITITFPTVQSRILPRLSSLFSAFLLYYRGSCLVTCNPAFMESVSGTTKSRHKNATEPWHRESRDPINISALKFCSLMMGLVSSPLIVFWSLFHCGTFSSSIHLHAPPHRIPLSPPFEFGAVFSSRLLVSLSVMARLLFPCLLGIVKYPWILHSWLLNLEMETLVQIFLAFPFRLLCEAFGASCCLFLETSWSVKNGLKTITVLCVA